MSHRDSTGFHSFCCHFISLFLTYWYEVQMLFLLTVKNASEYAFYVSRDEIVTITMATLLSTKHKLIFTAVHRTIMLTLHCTSVLQERLKQRIVVCSILIIAMLHLESSMTSPIAKRGSGLYDWRDNVSWLQHYVDIYFCYVSSPFS